MPRATHNTHNRFASRFSSRRPGGMFSVCGPDTFDSTTGIKPVTKSDVGACTGLIGLAPFAYPPLALASDQAIDGLRTALRQAIRKESS